MATIHKRTTYTIDDFEVHGEPLEWVDPVIRITDDGTRAVVGYLGQDLDPPNPLEDYDGEGCLYHHPRSRFCNYGPSNYFAVLGLDQYGEPDYTAAKELMYDHYQRAVEGMEDGRFQQFEQYGLTPTSVRGILLRQLRESLLEDSYNVYFDTKDLVNVLAEALADNDLCEVDYDQAWNFCSDLPASATLQELRDQCRAEGKIGDPDAVLLDIYEHSGVAYSVSGQGTQCRWDTSSGAAVWVPDDACRERIDDLEEMFRRSTLAELRTVTAVADAEGNIIAEFQKDDWAGIWGLMKDRCAVQCVEREPAVARAMAREHLAKQFCEMWNQYINGDCYYVCVVSYQKNGDTYDETDYQCHGGVFGSKEAEDSMHSEVEATFKCLNVNES